MPLLSVNASDNGPALVAGGDLNRVLKNAIDDLPRGAPVVLMTHGFKFSPSRPDDSPHDHILGPGDNIRGRKAVSWARRLGLVAPGREDRGLAIGFGWESRGSIWQAYRSAERSGAQLALLARMIRDLHDGPLTLMGHSLGARVALSSLHHLSDRTVDRMVFLAAAEFRAAAQAARRTTGGEKVEIVNVRTGENAVYDLLLEAVMGRWPGSALGNGGLQDPRWCDLRLDDEKTLQMLAGLGYAINGRRPRVCHWSLYLRAGVFDLYGDLLAGRHVLPMAELRRMGKPSDQRSEDRPDRMMPMGT